MVSIREVRYSTTFLLSSEVYMQMDKPTRWSLDILFPSPDGPEIKKALADLDRRVAKAEKSRRLLSPRMSAAAFVGLVREFEEIRALARRIAAFAELHFCEDTQNQAAQTLLANTEQHMAEIENRLLFFSTWWKALPAAPARRLLAGSGPYRYYLEQIRRMAPHTLSEPEEKVINIKNATGSRALATLYQAITNRYLFDLEVDGARKQFSRAELTVFTRSPDASVREAAYRSMYSVYSREGPILGQIYSTLVRDWRNENVRLRKFTSPVAVRNLANDLPDKVVRLLLDVCRANAPVFQKYFGLKARALGMPKLRRYDIYAPIAPSEKQFGFGRAWDLVRKSFEEFDPAFASLAERVVTDRRLDAEVRPGKRDGAFCMSVLPSLTPWVLTNYQGRAYDLATLAHELGHAVHALLAEDLPLFTYDASLPLAETASTFAEMLLVESLLKKRPASRSAAICCSARSTTPTRRSCARRSSRCSKSRRTTRSARARRSMICAPSIGRTCRPSSEARSNWRMNSAGSGRPFPIFTKCRFMSMPTRSASCSSWRSSISTRRRVPPSCRASSASSPPAGRPARRRS